MSACECSHWDIGATRGTACDLPCCIYSIYYSIHPAFLGCLAAEPVPTVSAQALAHQIGACVLSARGTLGDPAGYGQLSLMGTVPWAPPQFAFKRTSTASLTLLIELLQPAILERESRAVCATCLAWGAPRCACLPACPLACLALHWCSIL